MPYLSPEDFNNKIYVEKVEAITGGDTTLLPTAIDTGIAEAKLYLSRFDLIDLFGKTGTGRDPILLQWVKDVSVWQLIGLTNPGVDYEDTETRYNNAIKGLKGVQGSPLVPDGWKLKDATDAGDPGTSVHVSSATKRNTYR